MTGRIAAASRWPGAPNQGCRGGRQEAGIVSAGERFADRRKNSRHLCAMGFPRPFPVSTQQ